MVSYDPYVHDILRSIAFQLSRGFPKWVLSFNDLVQIGWVGALEIRQQPHQTMREYQNLQILAGKRQMLDAFRTVQDLRRPTGHRLDLGVEDIVEVADGRIQVPGIEEQGWIENYDLAFHVAKLSPLTQRILFGRFHGRMNREIGIEEHLSHSRVSQIFKIGIQDLKKSGLVYDSFADVL